MKAELQTQVMPQYKNEVQAVREKAQTALIDGIRLINKDYLVEMPNWQVQPLFSQSSQTINIGADVRLFRVERIVLENKQSVLESMTAAYTALGTAGFAVFILLESTGQETYLYLGTRGQAKKTQGQTAGNLLQETFKGHFAGSLLTPLNGENISDKLAQFKQEQVKAVTAVSGVPSLSVDEREHFMQGLERFIDAAEGHQYQALILAEPVSPEQLAEIRIGYEQVATQISPLLKQQVSYGENQSEAVSLSLSQSISDSLGTSLTMTEGTNTSQTNTTSQSTSHTKGTNESTSGKSAAGKVASVSSGAMGLIGAVIGTLLGPAGTATGAVIGSSIGGLVGNAVATAFSDTHTKGTSESTSESTSTSQAQTIGTSTSQAKSTTNTRTIGETNTQGNTQTLGNSRQFNLELVDKQIEQWLKRIDHQLERLDNASNYGAWQSAAYFIGGSTASTETLASIFLGLMRGDDSNAEGFALTTWANSKDDSKMNTVLSWLQNLSHPQLKADSFASAQFTSFTPATLVSGKEMAIQLSLPRSSTSATPVIQTQAFGRSIQSLDQDKLTAKDKSIQLGKVRHLWTDTAQNVVLNANNLTSHVFVTGSTGSGKSNTVYEMLRQLDKQEIPFLVIEPAKGEYKHVFGHQDNVRVLSTNPAVAEVLKINPFKFPQGVHVFEHIDRLVEIFNVCWPMYAAMPAVLKEAMLLAYETAGWDLQTSQNNLADDFFPTFADLLDCLENVVNRSAYSDEVKSNYIGSLVTRVRSLTNGLNSQIFCRDEIGDEALFDRSVIVDLSRVGSQETKSLIMGLLILRLSEYRMTCGQMNAPLRHVTVLEEAHNILRTSTEPSAEGANVAGKSVEMLANCIAEMRTYGESFIIADQSPNAVDICAIRNTNTKIVMRLPDEADRQLVGKAAALTDDQLSELSKLPKGVAVVYQNNWLEPVLCHINKFAGEEKPYQHTPTTEPVLNQKAFKRAVCEFLLAQRTDRLKAIDLASIKQGLKQLQLISPVYNALSLAVREYEERGRAKIWEREQFNKLSNLLVKTVDLKLEFNKVNNVEHYFDELSKLFHQQLISKIGECDRALSINVEQCAFADYSLDSVEAFNHYRGWLSHHRNNNQEVL